MHLEAGKEESRNRRKDRRQNDTDKQCEPCPSRRNDRGEVEDVSEYRTGIDALMHDDGRSDHAHADHTADRKVGTSQKDQSRNAKSKEHAGRCLLQNVQDVVHREQGGMLDDRGDDTQHDENQDDDNVKSVL